MHRVLALLLLIPIFSLAGPPSSFKITASGGSPIPTAYSAANTQSLAKSGLRYQRWLCVYNSTGSVIAVNTNGTTTLAPTADVGDIYMPAGVGRCLEVDGLNTVYIRSDSGSTITSGVVYGDVR